MALTTDIRRALAAALVSLEVDVQVATAPLDYEPRLTRLSFAVRVIVGQPGDAAAEDLLDELLEREGERSVRALIEADRTLGGLVADCTAPRCTGWQIFPARDGPEALGATWTVSTLV